MYANGSPLTVVDVRPHVRQSLAVLFKNFTTVEDAEKLRGLELFVYEDSLPPLKEGNYYHYQLLGLEVQNLDGEKLGRINEVINTNGNDVYVVKSKDGTEILVPAIVDAVKSVDIEGKIITVDNDLCVVQSSKNKT